MNRRAFLSSVPAVALAASPALAAPQMSLEELCDYQAAQLRDTLQKLHGGAWNCHVNHHTKAAFVVCKHA